MTFCLAVILTICSQLPSILGFDIQSSSQISELLFRIFENIDQIHWPTLLLALEALTFLIVGTALKRCFARSNCVKHRPKLKFTVETIPVSLMVSASASVSANLKLLLVHDRSWF